MAPVASSTARSGAAPHSGASGEGLRPYAGQGFSLKVPSDWMDLTVHTLTGPPDRDFVPALWVAQDRDPGSADVGAYADARIEAHLASMPGSVLALKKPLSLPSGLGGVKAEIRWYPTDDKRLYYRALWIMDQGRAFSVTAQMTKRARKTAGPGIDRMMLSFRRAGPGGAPAPAPPGSSYRGDGFILALEKDWRHETVFILTEPVSASFRRTLVISESALEEPPASPEEAVAAEIEEMRGSVPGFDLLAEEPKSLGDGGPATRLRLRRLTGKERYVAQDMLMAVRGEKLITVAITAEETLPAAERARLDASLGSFTPEAAG